MDSKGRPIIKLIEYTGTIESYNDLVDSIYEKECEYNHIIFLDNKHRMTPKFTGIVMDMLNGIIYKPGDHYIAQEHNKDI